MSCLKKIIQHHKFVNPLKMGQDNVLSMNHTNIVPLTRNRTKLKSLVEPRLWVKFDSDTFDGIHILGFLADRENEISSTNCNFVINSVSNDGVWAESLVASGAGIPNGTRFTLSVPSSSFGSLSLDSETTLSVTMTIERQGLQYKKKIFVNHLGVYESVFKLRQDVEFLDITKVDE